MASFACTWDGSSSPVPSVEAPLSHSQRAAILALILERLDGLAAAGADESHSFNLLPNLKQGVYDVWDSAGLHDQAHEYLRKTVLYVLAKIFAYYKDYTACEQKRCVIDSFRRQIQKLLAEDCEYDAITIEHSITLLPATVIDSRCVADWRESFAPLLKTLANITTTKFRLEFQQQAERAAAAEAAERIAKAERKKEITKVAEQLKHLCQQLAGTTEFHDLFRAYHEICEIDHSPALQYWLALAEFAFKSFVSKALTKAIINIREGTICDKLARFAEPDDKCDSREKSGNDFLCAEVNLVFKTQFPCNTVEVFCENFVAVLAKCLDNALAKKANTYRLGEYCLDESVSCGESGEQCGQRWCYTGFLRTSSFSPASSVEASPIIARALFEELNRHTVAVALDIFSALTGILSEVRCA